MSDYREAADEALANAEKLNNFYKTIIKDLSEDLELLDEDESVRTLKQSIADFRQKHNPGYYSMVNQIFQPMREFAKDDPVEVKVERVEEFYRRERANLSNLEEFIDSFNKLCTYNRSTIEKCARSAEIRQSANKLATANKNTIENVKKTGEYMSEILHHPSTVALETRILLENEKKANGQTELETFQEKLTSAASSKWNSAEYNNLVFSVKVFCDDIQKNRKLDYKTIEKDVKKINKRIQEYMDHVKDSDSTEEHRENKKSLVRELKNYMDQNFAYTADNIRAEKKAADKTPAAKEKSIGAGL